MHRLLMKHSLLRGYAKIPKDATLEVCHCLVETQQQIHVSIMAREHVGVTVLWIIKPRLESRVQDFLGWLVQFLEVHKALLILIGHTNHIHPLFQDASRIPMSTTKQQTDSDFVATSKVLNKTLNHANDSLDGLCFAHALCMLPPM